MLTVYGIETRNSTFLSVGIDSNVATVLTVYGIETLGSYGAGKSEALQQCLPFTVLKLVCY